MNTVTFYMPLADRLEQCRKALEDATVGWKTIANCIGSNDTEEI